MTPSSSPRFLVKGTELSNAIIPGTLSRFLLAEVRSYGPNGEPDRAYRLHDAATVTLAEVREGKRPRSVGTFQTIEAAIDAAMEMMR